MVKKLDKKKIDTLEKGLRNLSEHENLAPRLLKHEKRLSKVESSAFFNWLSLIILIIIILVFGGLLP